MKIVKRLKIKPKDNKIIINIPEHLNDKDLFITVEQETKTRSNLQNKSLHLYFTQLADALNLAGMDIRKVISKEVDIEWSGIAIKEYLWRPLQKEMFKKKSTTQLTTEDINIIYDNVNRIIGERTGVFVPWPCVEMLFNER